MSTVMPADDAFVAVPVVLSRDRAVARLHALTAIAKATTGASGFTEVLHSAADAAMVALVDETYQVTDYPFITRMFDSGVGVVQDADCEPDAPGSDASLVALLRVLRKGSGLSVPI